MDRFRSTEQAHFSALVASHIREQDGPLLLEGGTGLGKTRAYLAALANSGLSVAIVLPTHQLIDQLAASADRAAVGLEVTAFRPAARFERRADYLAARDAAMAGRVMLCTAASVIIDQRLRGGYNGATARDYILFDEADQLPQAAALQRDLTITAEDLKAAGIPRGDMRPTLEALLAARHVPPEVRARALIIQEALSEPAWRHKAGPDDDGGIALFHHLPGRLLKPIANRGNVAFVSATLSIAGTFDDFRRSLGIGAISRFSGRIEPAKHGALRVETPVGADPVDIVMAAEKPCLVAMASHQEAEVLAARLPGAVARAPDETTAEAARSVPPNGTLIAAGAWAGLDTPIRWASIVIPRIPFERPQVLDDKIESRYIDSRNVAVRRMRQVVGRGLRTPDADCAIYILDERYERLGQFLPDRFQQSWAEGARTEVTLSEAERDKAIRRAALKRYGCKCHACGLVPPHPSIIEVHHLNPIAEGERKTKLEDVIPLCANCHRLAHTRRPAPIPLAELQAMAQAEK